MHTYDMYKVISVGRLIPIYLYFSILMMAVLVVPSSAIGQEKLTAEDVVNKHLESLGEVSVRDPARSRTAKGSSLMTLKTGGSGQASGPAIMKSKDGSMVIDATFDSPDYPYELITFDGKQLTVKQFRPGARSPLGEFFLAFDEIFKEGLVGGALTSSWSMLHVTERRPKLKLEKMDKIDGRPVHRIKYEPRKGSDLRITLYFDVEDFRHVRTEYERSVAAQSARIGSPSPTGSSSAQQETRFRVVENYSDFVTAAGLTLPKTYAIEYSIFSRSPVVIEWVFNFDEFAFNQPFQAADIKADKK